MKAIYINRKEGDVSVDGSLICTPSDMLRMTQEGRAICSAALSGMAYHDADYVGQGDVPLENRRGVDQNTVWTETKRAKSKVRKLEKEMSKVC